MTGENALTTLFDHLDRERTHLLALNEVLIDEAEALRRMALDDLLEAGRRKALIAEEQAHIARRRLEHLHAVDPGIETLGALAERLGDEDRTRLDVLRADLADLLERAAAQNQWNHTFAETGRALVEGTLRVIRGRAAGASATYGGNGRIRTGEPRSRVDRRA